MKSLVCLLLVGIISGCVSSGSVEHPGKHGLSVNKGTNTAVVKVSLDKRGMPYIDTDPVVVKQGQRVVWVGPTDMEIKFQTDGLVASSELSTKDAVINLAIPVFDNWDESETQRKYKYDVIVKGVVLDPIIIIRTQF